VRGEQSLYLRQPAYGTSYLIGKAQIEQLIGDRKRQMGDAFTLQKFMDEYGRGRADPDLVDPMGADRRIVGGSQRMLQ
jgi:uncharacterized protein (DUF885 family)